MRIFLLSLLFLLSASFVLPHAVSAQGGAGTGGYQSGGTGTGGSGSLINPLSAGTNLQTFLTQILDFIIRIGTIVVILMLVYVGYLFVAARGAPDKIENAKKALLWTLVGALVLLGAKAIALAIQATVAAVTV